MNPPTGSRHHRRRVSRSLALTITLFAVVLAAVALFIVAGAASSSRGSAASDPDRPAAAPNAAASPAAVPNAAASPATAGTATAIVPCAATVLGTLGHVAARVYAQGTSSQLELVARRFIARSAALRQATAAGDPIEAANAIRALHATGHVGRIRILRAGTVLADVGPRNSLAPIRGTIVGHAGAPVGSYVATIFDDRGYAAALRGLTGATVSIRAGARQLVGPTQLAAVTLPLAGGVDLNGVGSEVFSIPAQAFPSGPLRIYVTMPVARASGFCGSTGASSAATEANMIGALGVRLYQGELNGTAARRQVARVAGYRPLLDAVARGDTRAVRAAIVALLNQHIVRLRVLTSNGRLLADVGGPRVLAPIGGTLRRAGRVVGRFVLSVQDDLGYMLLAQRLLGAQAILEVAGQQLIGPGAIAQTAPAARAYSFSATAFPSGRLRITLLIPAPTAAAPTAAAPTAAGSPPGT